MFRRRRESQKCGTCVICLSLGTFRTCLFLSLEALHCNPMSLLCLRPRCQPSIHCICAINASFSWVDATFLLRKAVVRRYWSRCRERWENERCPDAARTDMRYAVCQGAALLCVRIPTERTAVPMQLSPHPPARHIILDTETVLVKDLSMVSKLVFITVLPSFSCEPSSGQVSVNASTPTSIPIHFVLRAHRFWGERWQQLFFGRFHLCLRHKVTTLPVARSEQRR